MKKRTAFIGAILSLIPLGQPLLIKTGVVLSTTGLMLSLPEKVNSESADFYFDRGNSKIENNENALGAKKAILDFDKAIEINPNLKRAYVSRCYAKYLLKEYYSAISDCNIAIKILPKDVANDSRAYANRGLAKKNLGDMNGACSDWRTAFSLGLRPERLNQWLRNQC
tara:strand:- start:81 stop:584 length:504 start_codon:yes stop_codon:yes gene_type:complete